MNHDMVVSLAFLKAHPLDAVRVLEGVPREDAVSFFETVPSELAADVIRMMDPLIVNDFARLMKPDIMSAIAEKLPLENASLILRKMDPPLKDSVLNTLPPEILDPINLLLRFPEDTAGALMDPRYFALPQDILAKEALERLRDHPTQSASYLYVVDRDHILAGFIHMREMLNLKPNTPISTILNIDIWKLTATSDRQAILMNPGWRVFHTLPVVDQKGVFLGAVDYQTIRRLEQEMSQPHQQNPLNNTVTAMGELFWVGFSGLVKGAVSAANRLRE